MTRVFTAVIASFLLTSNALAAQTFKATDAKSLTDPTLWQNVRAALEKDEVEVLLAPGSYALSSLLIEKTGSDAHVLTIRGEQPDGTVITEDPADTKPNNFLFDLRNCRNVTLKDLHFRGPANVGGATIIRDCVNVTIEHCSWHDINGALYSALSIINPGTRHVRVNNCDFRRVGFDPHAHMMYCATGARFINVTNSHFEDCAGEYVRFRNQTDFCVVWNCDFLSTGKYKDKQSPFVSSPLFNDEDPASTQPLPAATQEYFGTHYLIAHNRFRYANEEKVDKETRWAFYFHHSGYDPPGRQHLFTKPEAEELATSPVDHRKQMMLQRCNIDMNEVHIYDNVYENVDRKCAFRTYATYGAKSKGFAGSFDLSDLINQTPVAKTEQEAINFYKD